MTSDHGLAHVPSLVARALHNRRALWRQDRSFARTVLPDEWDDLCSAMQTLWVKQICSTRLHRGNQSPSGFAGWPKRSTGHVRFFLLVVNVGTVDPLLGPFPVDTQAFEDFADAFDSKHSAAESLLETHLGDQF